MINVIKKIFNKTNNKKETPSDNVKKEHNIQDYFSSFSNTNLKLCVGDDFVDYLDTIFLDDLDKLRKDTITETGFVLPLVKVVTDKDLQENQYVIYIRDKKVFEDFVVISKIEETKEITNKLKELCFEYIDDVFSNEILELYIKTVQINNSYLIWELMYKMQICCLKEILINLIRNEIKINYPEYIFEKIAKIIAMEPIITRNPDKITQKLIEELK